MIWVPELFSLYSVEPQMSMTGLHGSLRGQLQPPICLQGWTSAHYELTHHCCDCFTGVLTFKSDPAFLLLKPIEVYPGKDEEAFQEIQVLHIPSSATEKKL